MKREMLLFGAGASKEAGVPTAIGLTQAIADEFRRQGHLSRHSRVVSFVLGGLLFNRGIQGDDPLRSGVNVEEFFNAIQILADRSTLEAAPFVGSWHAMVEEFDKVQPHDFQANRLQEAIFNGVSESIWSSIPTSLPSFGATDVDRKLEDMVKKSIEAAVKGRSISSSAGVGREVGEFVIKIMKDWIERLKRARPSGHRFNEELKRAVDRQPRPGGGRIFHEVADHMIRMLAKFVYVQDKSAVDYFHPLKKLAAAQPKLTVATLNYDNCVELFCREAGVRCDTGIEKWSSAGTFDLDGDGLLLLKLHGSIDWQSREGRSVERPMPHRVITQLSVEDIQKENYQPAVIFGQRNKLTAEGPFLDLLRAFQRELEIADRITVVGYSFADLHINVYLSHWLNSSPLHQLRIVDPAFGEAPSEYSDELIKFGKQQLEIIKEPAGQALQRLFGRTDEVPLKGVAA